jgi:hypothetical protein
MFDLRSFNVVVIAVLAVLSIGTAIYSQQAAAIPIGNENLAPVADVGAVHSVPSDYAALKDRQLSQVDPAPADRILSSAYVDLKDRALSQSDHTSTQVARVNLSSAERYAMLKASQLESAEVTTVAEQIGIPVTGSAKTTSVERYANLKEAQLARLNPTEPFSAGRARYVNLKEAQLGK